MARWLESIILLVTVFASISSGFPNKNVAQDIIFLGAVDGRGIKVSSQLEFSAEKCSIRYDGDLTVASNSSAAGHSLCMIYQRKLQQCVSLASPIIGEIAQFGLGGNHYVFTDAAGKVWRFVISDENVGSLIDTEIILTDGHYVSCTYSECYYYKEVCDGPINSMFQCIELSNAVGAPYFALRSKIGYFVTKTNGVTTISTSEQNSFVLDAAHGDVIDIYETEGLVIVWTTNSLLLFNISLELQGTIDGAAHDIDATSIYLGDVVSTVIVIAEADQVRHFVYSVHQEGKVKQASVVKMADPGSFILTSGGETVGYSPGRFSVIKARFGSTEDNVVRLELDPASVPIKPGSNARLLSSSGGSCIPTIIKDGVLQAYSGQKIQWLEVCSSEDPTCQVVTQVQVGTDNTLTTIFIALAASFTVIPASIIAYRTRKICKAKESKADGSVSYDPERGVYYDSAYEEYVNQYTKDSNK